MGQAEYKGIDARFRSVFERYAAQLSDEGREHVQHLIECSELEMACESFILSLLEERIQLSDDVKEELLELAVALELHKESVFRADFWQIASSLLGLKR